MITVTPTGTALTPDQSAALAEARARHGRLLRAFADAGALVRLPEPIPEQHGIPPAHVVASMHGALPPGGAGGAAAAGRAT